jgi:hypothetical protein
MANTKTHLSWRLLRVERLQKSCLGGFLRGAPEGRSGVLLFLYSEFSYYYYNLLFSWARFRISYLVLLHTNFCNFLTLQVKVSLISGKEAIPESSLPTVPR